MAVCNGERFVREAVDSIVNQSFRDFEFIVIDDGSTDGTRTIIESYSDPRIRAFRNEQNIGLTRSLNKGLALARGKYIARQDADDISYSHRFACQTAYLRSHPEIVALGAQLCFIDEDGLPIGNESRVTRHDDIVAMLMRGEGALPHPVVMMRADVIGEVGGYREKFMAAQDLDLWLRLAERGRLANLESVLLKYRLHELQVGSARRELQLKAARHAVIDAYDRQGKPTPMTLEIDGQFAVASWELHHRWSLMALRAGNRLTAIKHAMIGVRQARQSATSWWILLTSICPRVQSRLRDMRQHFLANSQRNQTEARTGD
ncbi:glycosyltransferase [Desulfoferrobacter suflitae]|uniref:glycosyltransferase n=1 Tax=Desulfoferrobacter suflitae TaxID=2865782 RepID=UPI002164A766|nr:glycosyltransferase [Desulfoferrobacter suflitae]MCK8600205.1 glycosyltransferase [Desulfoferrobacter suflitae]